jgi:hypothetical protein
MRESVLVLIPAWEPVPSLEPPAANRPPSGLFHSCSCGGPGIRYTVEDDPLGRKGLDLHLPVPSEEHRVRVE